MYDWFSGLRRAEIAKGSYVSNSRNRKKPLLNGQPWMWLEAGLDFTGFYLSNVCKKGIFLRR